MSIRLLTVFLCVAVGTATGYIVMLAYKKNAAYLAGLCGLIGELKRNMAYRRDTVVAVLSDVKSDSALLKKHVEEYKTYASSKDGTPNISRGFLSDEVYARVREFFCSLGKSDGNSQMSELEAFDSIFEKLRTAAELKYKKYGTVAVKLGFWLGLGVGVLTL